MDRRDFIRQMGMGLAASWALARFAWPLKSFAAGPELRLAVLADAHLKNSDDRRPEPQALARAVAEINALSQAPNLVLFAGDLAHKGRPDALDLGREILNDLATPLWAVPGEGDLCWAGASPWVRRFGSLTFSRVYRGVHFLGLDTTLVRTSNGPAFEIGRDQGRWLATELARLDDATPLVIVSHAPLACLFHPWQQWTADAVEIAPLLSRFRQLLYLHGHVHMAGIAGVGSKGLGARKAVGSAQWPVARDNDNDDINFSGCSLTESRKQETENCLRISLPATAWPLPQAMQGTPKVVRPGVGPQGCGWVLVNLGPIRRDFRPHLWQG